MEKACAFSDEDMKKLEEWLKSDEGKKAIAETQMCSCSTCKAINSMNDIDPWIYREPFDI